MASISSHAHPLSPHHPHGAQQWVDAELEREKIEAAEDGCGRGIMLASLASVPFYLAAYLVARYMGWV